MLTPNPIMDGIFTRKAKQKGRAAEDAVDFVYMSTQEIFDTPYKEVERIQLASLRQRFDNLVDHVAPLKQLADSQKITRIDRIEDAAPLLFGPKVLKSYPLSLLENRQYDKLTTWLGRLTSHDLSGVDLAGCETIDEWLDRLEAQTPMMLMHSSGTSGKLSIMPRSKQEIAHFVEIWWKSFEPYHEGEDIGGNVFEAAKDEAIPIFLPSYRLGRHIQLPLSLAAYYIAKTEDAFVTTYPGRLSADLLSLGGRLAAAEGKGSVQVTLNPALLDQRRKFLEFHEQQADYTDAYFKRMLAFQGRRVVAAGTWTVQVQAALAAEKLRISHAFAPNSFVSGGGGKKNSIFPDDWYERVCRMYGKKEIRTSYGMVEMAGKMQQCCEGNFHPWPFQIMYQLKPQTGVLLPRQGVQRGRFAFFDLSAETYWGGGLSGDEVTIDWNGGCTCGRPGPYVTRDIQRLSEGDGGDDKISCAGAQASHDEAVEYLARL